jgi:heat shock protein HslJ
MGLAIVAVSALAGCGSEGVTSPSALEGQTWRLTRLERQGQAAVSITNPDQYTLMFNEDQRLGARSDCNQCGGSYELRGTSFAVGALACTKAFCGEQSFDSDYSSILGDARSLEMDGGDLVVRSNRGVLRLTR